MSYTRPGVPERNESIIIETRSLHTYTHTYGLTDDYVNAVHKNGDVFPYGRATNTGVHLYLQEVAKRLDHLPHTYTIRTTITVYVDGRGTGQFSATYLDDLLC